MTAAALAGHAKVSLPEMGYGYDKLEPVICTEIMTLHHSKHHAAYVKNYNAAIDKLAEAVAKGDASAIIALQPALRFNGGGHLNHSIFWKNLCPTAEALPGPPAGSPLAAAIERDFGSVDAMKEKLSAASAAVQGSGWGWLGYEKATGTLRIATCKDQDPLEATLGLVPIFGIDVWEHAYYLQYKNARPDYTKAIWQVANWKDMAERYAAAGGK